MINLVAEDNAIEDTLYHLHRALGAGRIDLERFLRVSPGPQLAFVSSLLCPSFSPLISVFGFSLSLDLLLVPVSLALSLAPHSVQCGVCWCAVHFQCRQCVRAQLFVSLVSSLPLPFWRCSRGSLLFSNSLWPLLCFALLIPSLTLSHGTRVLPGLCLRCTDKVPCAARLLSSWFPYMICETGEPPLFSGVALALLFRVDY